ncbi:RNase adapter RapZ [uncultured Paludibaculum sp.]|uniref:RNase adapter RapZ n=1 Tax=uncultured Paludibaculum sp. TaxID=1765020 RepID=UPI002AAA7C43|nr:RNase adapter RapZ [uncultured Paludibaculum sp.]
MEEKPKRDQQPELVIITGLSGSGKGTVLKTLEDHGYYSVDNLPLDLIPKFAELTRDSPNIRRAALVVDIREREQLQRFPDLFTKIKRSISTRLIFLDADDDSLVRRYSETRRPHPLGGDRSVLRNVRSERRTLEPIRALADHVINTTELNVHQLRKRIVENFGASEEAKLRVYVMSFGFRHGVPPESDLVFDVRFLPNPNYIPEFKNLTGRNPGVARYIRSFPQTAEFMERISSLLLYLMPHYTAEGKSYLTISIGCTGGQHRSVMMAEEINKRLSKAGYSTKVAHRDIEKK